MRTGLAIVAALVLCCSAWLAAQTTQPASPPADNVDYWLDQAEPADGEAVADDGAPAEAATAAPPRAVPGVIQFSDDRMLAGRIWTTAGRTLDLYVDPPGRWRRVPLAAALSLTAELIAEALTDETRPAEIGSPDRVYTGRQIPSLAFRWRLRLADGSELVGAIRGQPIWILAMPPTGDDGRTSPPVPLRQGPFILAETVEGPPGASTTELVYVSRVVISARAAETVLRHQASTPTD
ncbi:MAG: hypothetical protein ACYTFO_06340 [Planctomycetota bacterium]|jgi:hypothetical protein